jgi:hypothetical protein
MEHGEAKVYAAELEDRGALQPCSRCGCNNFAIAGRSDDSVICAETKRLSVVPAVLMYCKKCGLLFRHSIKVLLNSEEDVI